MGLFSKEELPKPVSVKGKKLKCNVCEHDQFTYRPSQLNTAGMSMLGLDWANKTAHCYVCKNCTHIHWFLEKL